MDNNSIDTRCWEGKKEAEGKVKDKNLENFLDSGAESKDSLVKEDLKDVKLKEQES